MNFPSLALAFLLAFMGAWGQKPLAAAQLYFAGHPVSAELRFSGKSYSLASCMVVKSGYRCGVEGIGTLYLDASGYKNGVVNVVFAPRVTGTFEGVRFTGNLGQMAEPKALSNGWQSWSPSGWIRVGKNRFSDSQLLKALTNNDEVQKGNVLSRGFSVIKDDVSGKSMVVGATRSKKLKAFVQFSKEGTDVKIRFGSGFSGEKLVLSSLESAVIESFYIGVGNDYHSLLKKYAELLTYAPHFGSPVFGWNSWYQFWNKVGESDIRDHLRVLSDIKERLPTKAQNNMALVIDDGWQKSWGDWVPGPKFPGFEKLAADISGHGIMPGIWLAPFLISKDSPLWSKTDWHLGGTDYRHPSGTYKILDLTHPEAEDYVVGRIRYLVGLGFKILKTDFLMTQAFHGERYSEMTPTQAYHHAMQVIREAAGQHAYILACGAPLMETLPYANSIRIGADIAFQFPGRPAFVDLALTARSLGSRYFLCGSIHCDTDPLLLRRPHTKESSRLAAWVTTLSGGGMFLSDNLTKLPDRRLDWAIDTEVIETSLSGRPYRPIENSFNELGPTLRGPRLFDRPLNRSQVLGPKQWISDDGDTVFTNLSGKRLKIRGLEIPGWGVGWRRLSSN